MCIKPTVVLNLCVTFEREYKISISSWYIWIYIEIQFMLYWIFAASVSNIEKIKSAFFHPDYVALHLIEENVKKLHHFLFTLLPH